MIATFELVIRVGVSLELELAYVELTLLVQGVFFLFLQDLPTAGQGSDNTARRILDGVGNVAGAVGSVSIRPTRLVCGWVADQVAPSYWVPNSKIMVSCENGCIHMCVEGYLT